MLQKVDFWQRRTTGVPEVQGSTVLLQVVPGAQLEDRAQARLPHPKDVEGEGDQRQAPRVLFDESVPSLQPNMREGPIH